MKIIKSKPLVPKIIPPENGWKKCSLYLVEVAHNPNNPIHVSTFYTGFLDNKGNPAGYNEVHTPGMHESYEISDIYYLKALKLIADGSELEKSPNTHKMVNELCS